MGFKTDLQSNNIDLQTILNTINALPEEGGGIELPDLVNEGVATDLVSGKQLIDQEGNVITGTNPYELNATNTTVSKQANLIAEIKTVLETKASVPGGTNGATFSVKNNLPDDLVINGYYCMSGSTTNNIPCGDAGIYPFVIYSIGGGNSEEYGSSSEETIRLDVRTDIYDSEHDDHCVPILEQSIFPGFGLSVSVGVLTAPPSNDGATLTFNLF